LDFQKLYCQVIIKSIQLCWNYKLFKEAKDLASKVVTQLIVFLIDFKIESEVRPNMKHESILLDCVKLVCIVIGIWVPTMDLAAGSVDRIADAFQTVRDLMRSCLSPEDTFRITLLGPLKDLAMKVSSLKEEKQAIEENILTRYKYLSLELEAEAEDRKQAHIESLKHPSETLDSLKVFSYLLKDNLLGVSGLVKSSELSKEPLKEPTVEESTEIEPTVIPVQQKTAVKPPTTQAKEKSEFKFYLQSFVKIGKRKNHKETNQDLALDQSPKFAKDKTTFKKKSKTGDVLDMDGYFNTVLNNQIPAAPIPPADHLPVYNRTYYKEKSFWVSNLRGKNISTNAPIMMEKVNNLDAIVRSDYDHMNMTIKVRWNLNTRSTR
jgi:hypothetical protein